MSTADVHVGDIGTLFKLTVKEGTTALDISSATTLKMKFQRRDKTTFETDATFFTDGVDGIVTYTTIAGDIDQRGKWYVQIYLEMPAWQGHTAKVDFAVEDPIAIA